MSTDFSDSSMYIPVKRNKTNNEYAFSKLRLIPLNEYIYNVYLGNGSFEPESFLKIFVDWLTELEKHILWTRILFLWKEKKETYEDVSNLYNVSWERVRQITESILVRIDEIAFWFSNTKLWSNLIIQLIENKEDAFVIDNSKNESYINGNFITYFYVKVLSKLYYYFYLTTWKDFCSKALMLDNKKYKDKVFSNIIKKISVIYSKKRPEEKIYSLSDLCAKNFTKDDLRKYEYPIFIYLKEVYNIEINWENFVMEKNQKKLKYFVCKELNLMDKPIHYKKLYKLLKEKYPEYLRTESKVMHGLYEYWRNVGNWLYVKQSHEMKWSTIEELAEDYLENEWKPVKMEKLIKYIKKNKIVKNDSIKAMLLKFNADKFVNLWCGNIGLRKRNLSPEVEKPLKDIIYDLFIEKNLDKVTAREVYSMVKDNTDFSYTCVTLKVLLEEWKLKREKVWNLYYYSINNSFIW